MTFIVIITTGLVFTISTNPIIFISVNIIMTITITTTISGNIFRRYYYILTIVIVIIIICIITISAALTESPFSCVIYVSVPRSGISLHDTTLL